MTWKRSARNQALVLIFGIVPALMFGLGASGFLIARALGLGNNSIWIALVLSTVGFVLSIFVTLRMGRQYERGNSPEGKEKAKYASA
jgi:Kef-type K+ transport system membrane component KefB